MFIAKIFKFYFFFLLFFAATLTQAEAFKGEVLGERLVCGMRNEVRKVIAFRQETQILRLLNSLQ